MPAGNDAKNAATELADQFGKGVGSADELVKTSRARYAGDLGAAQLKNADDVELSLDAVAKAAGVKDVVSATKRGDTVVYVHEDGQGRLVKGVVAADKVGSSAPAPAPTPAPAKKSKKEKAPEAE
jgi:hypothetical protein